MHPPPAPTVTHAYVLGLCGSRVFFVTSCWLACLQHALSHGRLTGASSAHAPRETSVAQFPSPAILTSRSASTACHRSDHYRSRFQVSMSGCSRSPLGREAATSTPPMPGRCHHYGAPSLHLQFSRACSQVTPLVRPPPLFSLSSLGSHNRRSPAHRRLRQFTSRSSHDFSSRHRPMHSSHYWWWLDRTPPAR